MTQSGLPRDVDQLVRERVGLSARSLGRPEARRAFERAYLRSGAADELTYARNLRRDPALFAELIDALIVSESYFLRDSLLFLFVGDELARRATQPLSIWSAGCAGGEELYSLAMVGEERRIGVPIRFVGSDVAPSVVARARIAEYGAWSLRGVSAELVARYFVALPNRRFRLAERLVRRANFYVQSLIDDAPAPERKAGFDLVLCRNVLIYLDANGIAAAARKLETSLAPGGMLITGPSDPQLSMRTLPAPTATPFGLVYQAESARVSAVHATPAVRPPLPVYALPSNDMHTPEAARPRTHATELIALPNEAPANDAALSAETHLKRGSEFIDSGQLSAAEDALRAALYLDPGLALAHFLSGWLCKLHGDARGARAAFERVLRALEGQVGECAVPFGDGLSVAELERIVRADLVDTQHDRRRA